jgi:hypothetical protein
MDIRHPNKSISGIGRISSNVSATFAIPRIPKYASATHGRENNDQERHGGERRLRIGCLYRSQGTRKLELLQ